MFGIRGRLPEIRGLPLFLYFWYNERGFYFSIFLGVVMEKIDTEDKKDPMQILAEDLHRMGFKEKEVVENLQVCGIFNDKHIMYLRECMKHLEGDMANEKSI